MRQGGGFDFADLVSHSRKTNPTKFTNHIIYLATCSTMAACHGTTAHLVSPALKGSSLTEDQIADLLTKGNDTKKAPHKKGLSSLSAEDAKAVATYVKSLK